jgi:hypothetical protein
MKEIGGDAVVLVETLQPDAMAAAAIALLEDPLRRASFGERAKDRAAQFTVPAMVRNTVDCYRSVAARFRESP